MVEPQDVEDDLIQGHYDDDTNVYNLTHRDGIKLLNGCSLAGDPHVPSHVQDAGSLLPVAWVANSPTSVLDTATATIDSGVGKASLEFDVINPNSMGKQTSSLTSMWLV